MNSKSLFNTTIVGVSTALAQGAISIVRVSGDEAITIVNKIFKEKDGFRIKGEKIEKLLKMTWFASDEAYRRFSNKMKKMGIEEKLREMGAKNGDMIYILDYEFEYRE